MAYASLLSLAQAIDQILQSQSQSHDEERHEILQSDDEERHEILQSDDEEQHEILQSDDESQQIQRSDDEEQHEILQSDDEEQHEILQSDDEEQHEILQSDDESQQIQRSDDEEQHEILQSDDEDRLFLHQEQLQLRCLHEKLCYLLSFLENLSPSNSKIVSSMETRIRDATYETEDLIESHLTKPIESHISKQILHQGALSCFEELTDVLHHCSRCLGSTKKTFEEKLQNAIEKFNSICEEVEKNKKKKQNNIMEGFQQLDPPLTGGLPSELESNSVVDKDRVEEAVKVHPRKSSRATSSKSTSTDETSMVGFQDDMRQIYTYLLNPQSTKLETITIVGMGGIGKTTLAKNIYRDSFKNSYFDVRAWTTASREYNLVALLANLLNSMGKPTHRGDIGDLKEKLYKTLEKQRYLIIIDDVWNTNISQEFGRALPDNNNGSRIIMTSRLSDVVGFNNSCNHIHRLNFLSPTDSWSLLKQKAFGDEICPPQLEHIGKRIAENCKGLALALVTVGGILRNTKKTQAQWNYVVENMKSAKMGNYENLMEILSWSYTQLPHHLRACFIYMGVYPEDFAVRISHLIMLWIANGFIKPTSLKTLEEVAKEYLEALIGRNLIIVRERYASGDIKTCVVHDLIKDLCINKANDEKFLLVVRNGKKIPRGVCSRYRHLSISDEAIRLSDLEDVYNSTIRSILCVGGRLKNMPFQLLKVFDAREAIFDGFPIELLQLVNLKYIALVCFKTSEIPPLISKLGNLQTLLVFIFSPHDVKIILPSEILKISQLRHLWVQGGILHHSSDGRNKNLQTLCGVRNLILTEKAIGIFPNLKSMALTYDEAEWKSSLLQNLVRLCQLEIFKLRINDSFLKLPLHWNQAFPVSLRKLSLRGFRLPQENMSMIGSLPNLEVLKLKYVEFDEEQGWRTNEGEFPGLKFLLLRRPDKFSWDLKGTVFPSLECLTLDGMYDLDRLPSEIGELANLKLINLYKCPSSVVDSAHTIRDEQHDYRNEDIQIHVYSGDVYKGKFKDYMLYGR